MWPDLFDLDCGPVVTGEKTIDEMGEILYNLVLDCVSGKRTWTEQYGLYNDFVPFNPAPIT